MEKTQKERGKENMVGRFGAGHFVGGFAPMGGFSWFWAICMVFRLAVLVVVVILAYRLLKSWSENHRDTKKISDDKALAILRERYAKGEIDTEEFNTRKSALD